MMRAAQTVMQRHWDWRAAGNFMAGGAGAGLLVTAVAAGGTTLWDRGLIAAGLALVGLGLVCVWLEIGRPLRAINVMLHVRQSWMSREALAAGVLFLLGAGLVLGMTWRAWPTALAAAVFLYCQARIVGAARAIPAWRASFTVPLLVTSGLAEGAGLYALAHVWQVLPGGVVAALALLVIARGALWQGWRGQVAQSAPPVAVRAVDGSLLPWQLLGTGAPLLLILLSMGSQPLLLALAGLLAAGTGAAFKLHLITRAGYHQGYVLPHLPVRGVPR
jgi:phenylacetyl-CoA:acceptor oxidoreductase subunit 2